MTTVIGDGDLYYFKDGEWVTVGEPKIAATGGTESDITVDGVPYKLHTFTASDDFVVTSSGPAEVFVLPGGGAPGSALQLAGGGGGAGGVFIESRVFFSVGTFSVVVGAGGAQVSTTNTFGNDGGESSIAGVVACGSPGWPRGQEIGSAGPAGRGGGNNLQGGPAFFPGAGSGGNGNGTNGNKGGGGGGAGGNGQNASTTVAGDGGAGKASSFSGTSVTYGGGGGGGARTGLGATAAGVGGVGGGGDGGFGSTLATDGVDGLAGGGGGFSSDGTLSYLPGAGGDGLVMVRYPA